VQELGGSIGRQPAQAGRWKYSVTWASCSVSEWAWLGRESYQVFHEFESSLVWEFELLQQFGLFWRNREICKNPECPSSLLGDWLWIGHWVVRSLFCIFIIIIVIIITIISISFVALLKYF